MTSTLTFDRLRAANVTRCERDYHPLADWSLTDWACAMAGEAGEACDVVKKLRRLEDDPPTDHAGAVVGRLDDDLAKELADTVIYADLLAARAGIDLGDAVRRKFNATSDAIGSAVRL